MSTAGKTHNWCKVREKENLVTPAGKGENDALHGETTSQSYAKCGKRKSEKNSNQ